MSLSRRSFIKRTGLGGTALCALPFAQTSATQQIAYQNELLGDQSPGAIAQNEDYWYHVQKAFKQSPHFINLENGYFCCMPLEVQDAQQNNIRLINETPSYYMRTQQHKDRTNVIQQLAEFAGVDPAELVITRNTTESLNTIVAGMDFEPGDEAVLTYQDYGSMQEQFKQQERRKGIKINWIELPLHPQSDEEIVELYANAITPRTKVILVTHLINLTGQVLPAKKIADMAHEKGVEVICDGAHSFAHIDYKIPDLNCDYFGTSLHKWLCCPLGSGLMHIKKEHIAKIWPLYGDVAKAEDDIRKFDHNGTLPLSTHRTLADALHFHQLIGSARKQARLIYLRNYWIDQVKELEHVHINSPFEASRSSAIGNVGVEGMKPTELADYLFEKHRIFTVAINHKSVKGVRITPHLYTTLSDLDRLVTALRQAA